MKFKGDKNNIKRFVIRLLVLTILLLYYPIVMTYINAEHNTTVCRDVKFDVKNNNSDMLISNDALERIFNGKFPNVKGVLLDSLQLMKKEIELESEPAIERCEMYTTAGGVLHVEAWQREPIMRIFNSNGTSHYVDSELQIIPAKYEMRTHVVIVNGKVNILQDTNGLLEICKYIRENEFWRSMVEQIYVTDKMEFVLVPRVGNHVIEFGSSERMEWKFKLLYKLYTEELDKLEWNQYKKISVKFQGQIICTKR